MTDDDEHMELEELASLFGIDAVAHSVRWRKVATGYPRRVALTYGGDIATALGHADEQVALHVAAWERSSGLTPLDWRAIGDAGRADDPDDALDDDA